MIGVRVRVRDDELVVDCWMLREPLGDQVVHGGSKREMLGGCCRAGVEKQRASGTEEQVQERRLVAGRETLPQNDRALVCAVDLDWWVGVGAARACAVD